MNASNSKEHCTCVWSGFTAAHTCTLSAPLYICTAILNEQLNAVLESISSCALFNVVPIQAIRNIAFCLNINQIECLPDYKVLIFLFG